MNSQPAPRFLAAIDLDGTLFGHDGVVGAANRAALDRLVAEGFGVVLASGRHAENMVEIARGLPMVRALVSCQGCEVSDAARERIFVQEFLPSGVVEPLMRAGTQAGFGVVAYTDQGEHVPGEGPDVERYRRIVAARLSVVPAERFSAARVHKVMWIGSEAALDASLAHGAGERCRPAAVETVRSHREVFEFVPRGVNKATGMAVLAKRFGLTRQRVAAFGDADNDLALFDWAGFSVAMPHAGCEVRRRATITAPAGCAEEAFARGVEALLASMPSGSLNGRTEFRDTAARWSPSG